MKQKARKSWLCLFCIAAFLLSLLSGCDAGQKDQLGRTNSTEESGAILSPELDVSNLPPNVPNPRGGIPDPSPELRFSGANYPVGATLTDGDARMIYNLDTSAKGVVDSGWNGFCGKWSFGDMNYYMDTENKETRPNRYVIDLLTGEAKPQKTPPEATNWTVSSGKPVVMQNRYLYEWRSYEETPDGLSVNRLLRSDAQTGEIKVMETVALATPFIYLNKLNEDEFISYYCALERYDSARNSLSVVEKYNVRTGEKTELIRERYRNEENWSNSEGTLLEGVCAVDNTLYAIGRIRKDGQYLFYLYQYDTQGTLLRQIPAQELELTLTDTQPISIDIIGNYLMFVDYTFLDSHIYRIDGDQVTLLVNGKTENIKLSAFRQNIYDSNASKYIYFHHDCTGDGEHRDNYIYGIDLQSGAIKCVDVAIQNTERKYLHSVKTDEDGNLILSMVRGHLKTLDVEEYYVMRDTITRLMDEA